MGLDYVRMGQPLSTLSGGEAQRLKLLHFLHPKNENGASRSATARGNLFILDEPTTGLHPEDIRKLVAVLNRLADSGHTILVVEHNLDFLASCDYLIDLGPEGGENGGRIVAQGTPEQIAADPASITGDFLKERLEGARGPIDESGEFLEAAEAQWAFISGAAGPRLVRRGSDLRPGSARLTAMGGYRDPRGSRAQPQAR